MQDAAFFFFCKPQPQLVSDQKLQASHSIVGNKIDPCGKFFYSCLKLFSHAEAFYSCLKLFSHVGSFLFMLELFSHAGSFLVMRKLFSHAG